MKAAAEYAPMIALYREWNERINVVSRKDIDMLYEAYASNPKEADGPVEWGDRAVWNEMHHSTPYPYSID